MGDADIEFVIDKILSEEPIVSFDKSELEVRLVCETSKGKVVFWGNDDENGTNNIDDLWKLRNKLPFMVECQVNPATKYEKNRFGTSFHVPACSYLSIDLETF